jgi:hypothetical protein
MLKRVASGRNTHEQAKDVTERDFNQSLTSAKAACSTL